MTCAPLGQLAGQAPERDIAAYRTRPVPLTDDDEHGAVSGEHCTYPVLTFQLHQLAEDLLSGRG